jgi:hypothetical protein
LLAYERKFQLCRFQLGLSAFSLFAHTRHLTEASGAGKEPGIAARDLCGNGPTLEGGNLVENLGILREEEDWNPESPRSPETPSLFDRWAMWMMRPVFDHVSKWIWSLVGFQSTLFSVS